jgi:hypothetical protein
MRFWQPWWQWLVIALLVMLFGVAFARLGLFGRPAGIDGEGSDYRKRP